MLTPLGMSTRAERAYRLLLSAQSTSLEELAAALEVPVAEVTEILDELAGLALLSTRDDHGIRVANPRVAFDQLLAHAEADAIERLGEVERAKATVEALSVEHESAREEVTLVRHAGVVAIRERLIELVAGAGEILSMTHRPRPIAEALRRGRPGGDPLGGDGRIRAVCLDSSRRDASTAESVEWLTGFGGDCRSAPSLPIRMVVVDRRTALLPIDESDIAAGAIEVGAGGLLTLACAMFDRVWADARPFGAPPPRRDSSLTPAERDVLRLLGEGCTDQAVAHRMDLSVRSVRRIIADLSARLGAESRFQAGVLAAERGWI